MIYNTLCKLRIGTCADIAVHVPLTYKQVQSMISQLVNSGRAKLYSKNAVKSIDGRKSNLYTAIVDKEEKLDM